MSIQRLSFVCDDLAGMARFWQATFGIVAIPTTDDLVPERQGLLVPVSPGCGVEYLCFPGMPGDRGSGDLRRLDLQIGDPARWAALRAAVRAGSQAGTGDTLPDGRIAVLDPSGLLLVCSGPTGACPDFRFP